MEKETLHTTVTDADPAAKHRQTKDQQRARIRAKCRRVHAHRTKTVDEPS